MYSRNYQGEGERRKHSPPRGYGHAEELRGSLLVPPDYRGEFLRRPSREGDIEETGETAERISPIEEDETEKAYDRQTRPFHRVPPPQKRATYVPLASQGVDAEAECEDADTPQGRESNAGGLLSELSSLLFGRGGEEDALLILGVGLLLINSRMERGKTPLFAGGYLHPEEDDIGLFLILLLLFS